MLSLAALNYRNIFTQDGGPVEKLMSSQFPILGKSVYQTNAFLKPGLTPNRGKYALFSDADGTGSNENPQIARHMAISESLERWAYHHTIKHNPKEYGMDEDNSSNGMAAFPGLFKAQAQKRAYYEALERWALVSWWDGRMDLEEVGKPFLGVHALRIKHDGPEGEVAILYRPSETGHVSYGYAAGTSIARAIVKATVELARFEFVISYYKLNGRDDEIKSYMERRCLHFASFEGYAEFLDKVRQGRTKASVPWKIRFDGEIPGEWSQYATVWRVAPQMPTLDFLNPKVQFFYW